MSAAIDDADIVHLHNLHGHYFPIDAVPLLARTVPLVWTVHDFFALTGGCAFPYECDRWMTQCGSCPGLGRYPLVTDFDRTRRLHSIKRSAFANLPVTIVSPSRHLARTVERSGMFPRGRVEIIPYGVDTDVFTPHREAARRALGLSRDAPVVALIAQGLDDPRKGTSYAVDALRRIEDTRATVLLAGGGEVDAFTASLGGHDVRSLGYVRDRAELARCLSAADVFVFTSLAENFPCIVQEAMACGTTVVAFDIDGVNEQIGHDRTGMLAPVGDVAALSNAIARALRDARLRRRIGEAARRQATTEWDRDQFVRRHENLYRKLRAAVDQAQSSQETVVTGS